MMIKILSISLAALAAAAPTTCPPTITSTRTASIKSTTTAIATFTRPGKLVTVTEPNYTSTKVIKKDGATTVTSYQSTGTATVVGTTTSIKCTNVVTRSVLDHSTSTFLTIRRLMNSNISNVEHTATVYEGTYTSSSLSAFCSPETTYTWLYPAGTETVTNTVTYGPVTTKYTPAVSTSTKYRKTSTEVVPEYGLPTTASSTVTITQNGRCTSTHTTATASATATYAAKCKPENLISGSSPLRISEPEEEWGASLPANKDASACCQACVDDEECAASWYRKYMGDNICGLYKNTEQKCGLAYALSPADAFQEDSGRHGQVGCGSVARRV